jgi:hypothetical protein
METGDPLPLPVELKRRPAIEGVEDPGLCGSIMYVQGLRTWEIGPCDRIFGHEGWHSATVRTIWDTATWTLEWDPEERDLRCTQVAST